MPKVKTSFVKKAFIDYAAPKPSADLTITKSESDGTFTITAKNLQGFDGYKASEDSILPMGWKISTGTNLTRRLWWLIYCKYKASDHENADGQYEAQVFYVDAKGQNKFARRKTYWFQKINHVQLLVSNPNNNKDVPLISSLRMFTIQRCANCASPYLVW